MTNQRPVIVVDAETEAIERRPEYPPKPTSVSIRWPGQPVKFLSWAHPSRNNCHLDTARKNLLEVWESDYEVVFHNAKFDLDVIETAFEFKPLPWHRIHDTMFLLFLIDPHSNTLALKPAAKALLGMAAEARDELADWIIAHVFTTESGGMGVPMMSAKPLQKAPAGMYKIAPTKFGKFISLAPGALVGKYADTDTLMTRDLFDLLYPQLIDAGMGAAYDRERKLIHILLENERRGVRTNLSALQRHATAGAKHIRFTDDWIGERLGVPGLDINKTDELADALEHAGMVDEWVMTAGGKRSLSKDNVEGSISNPEMIEVFKYRAKLNNTINNFVKPWSTMSKANNGYINFSWNQVRSLNDKGKSTGARTGRLSSTPNAQNATNTPSKLIGDPTKFIAKKDMILLPSELYKVVKQLPSIRSFVIPDNPGGAVIGVDFSGQELRLLGHFENTTMLAAYVDNPALDFHQLAMDALSKLLDLEVTRKQVKALAFCIIYGGGLKLLSTMLGVSQQHAERFKSAYYQLVPGLDNLIKALKRRARDGHPIYTLGGRRYFVEPPSFVDGQRRTYEYKLLNILIQGSASDGMKQAIINYDEARGPDARMLLSIHDEIIANVDGGDHTSEIKRLGDAMTETGNQLGCEVAFPTDAEYSHKNWSKMLEFIDTEEKVAL